MARGDDMTPSFRGDEDPASPTTQIFKAIQASGKPLNAANIRAYMEQLRSSPALPGGKPDLESGDDKGNRQSLTVERGSDDVAGKIESQGQRGNAGNAQTPSGPVDRRDDSDTASKTTSAQPTSSSQPPGIPGALPGDSDYSQGSGLGGLILGGLPLAYGAYKGLTGGGMAAGGGGAPTISLANAGGTPQLTGPDASPMESAMAKALAPNTGVPQLGAPPPAPPIALPDQSSGPAIPMPPPEMPSSVGGGIAQPRPNVTIDTSPQLSGQPPPIDFVQPRRSMPFSPNSPEFNALVRGLGRNAGRLAR